MVRLLTPTAGLLLAATLHGGTAQAGEEYGWHHARHHGEHRHAGPRRHPYPVVVTYHRPSAWSVPLDGAVVPYGDASIGRGLVYNVPPEPEARWSGAMWPGAIRARY